MAQQELDAPTLRTINTINAQWSNRVQLGDISLVPEKAIEPPLQRRPWHEHTSRMESYIPILLLTT